VGSVIAIGVLDDLHHQLCLPHLLLLQLGFTLCAQRH
jgi:hypothetical protein